MSMSQEKLHYAADHPEVQQAMQQCIQDSDFGREQDAICGWLYEWFRSDDPILQRFVARFAPELAKRYMFQCLSAQPTEPVPGLEVTHQQLSFVSSPSQACQQAIATPLACLRCCWSFRTAGHAKNAGTVQRVTLLTQFRLSTPPIAVWVSST